MDNEIKVNSVKAATVGQMDQIILWMSDVKNTTQGNYVYYVINSTGMVGSSGTTTGQVKVKNIFDLSGGINETTATTGIAGSYRGGSFDRPSTVYYSSKPYYTTLPNRTCTQYTGEIGSSRLILY